MVRKRTEETVTVTFRVTPLQRNRLDILSSFLNMTSSGLFGSHIDDLWVKAIQQGKMQEWLNVLAGVKPSAQEEKPAQANPMNM